VSDKESVFVGLQKPHMDPRREEYHLSINQLRREVRITGLRNSSLVRACIHRAEIEGLSGEDTMTLIAYFALRHLEDVAQQLADEFNQRPRPSASPIEITMP
jgi:hypothetical protein